MDFHDIVKEESEFDSEPTLVNCQNGVLDLVSGRMLEHTPDILIRNIVNARFICTETDEEPREINIESMEGNSLFFEVVSKALWDDNKSVIVNRETVRSFISPQDRFPLS